ncbi:MAG: SUMF1/EgtB/PvdO family nonheme iron enzyme [Acidobacteriota bacterium]|nr:MAG: SUMF1/EgtB/PvdO family nonheme iron enzyme [Acidobacteriota bacterium]
MSDDKKKDITASGESSVAAENINAPVYAGGVHHHYHEKFIPRSPADLNEFRQDRIAEWSRPQFKLDSRFVSLTLIMDMGDQAQERWHRQENLRFNDLGQALKKVEDHPVVVLLGAPGSGKSTLLRHLQLQHSEERLNSESAEVSFFIQLNGYRARSNGEYPEPAEWLNSRWKALYPQLDDLDDYLQNGRALLLLDALNEMPHGSDEHYRKLIDTWREFAQDAARQNNRIVFSCRGLNYSASLSGKELPVPQIEVQPMNSDQVRDFLKAYAPDHEERIWAEIDGKPQFSLYQTPFFLKLLCEQVSATGEIPKGRAALFTGFVRQVLNREINTDLFQSGTMLNEKDRKKLSLGRWLPFELPEGGLLIPKLSDLAFSMQQTGLESEGAQVRISYEAAERLIDHVNAKEFLAAGMAMNVLDEDLTQQFEIAFFHQLLQEYFAARRLAKEPNPDLTHSEWTVKNVNPSLEDTIDGLAVGDPLPPLPQTGWEETTVIAAPMSNDRDSFIRELIPHNLPLAARCAASTEVRVSDGLKREIQNALISRAQDMKADLRARISAGEALGEIGDPRFELRKGPFGDYLLPPLVSIPGGTYPIGLNDGQYDDEKPEHPVEIAAFQIGQFPVTNAEYKKFIDAGGYDDEQWWDTTDSLKWLREGGSEGEKQGWRLHRQTLQNWSEEGLRDLVKRNRATEEEVEDWLETRNWSDEEFESWLNEKCPAGKLYRQPEYLDDTRFNNHAQPVVGVTWFEARAYCNWLTANAHGVPPSGGQSNDSKTRLKMEIRTFSLPTEVEFEAAARGEIGRKFSYGNDYDPLRANVWDTHIRRTSPVGIFDNATPEGAYDLTGNVWTWTLSEYKPYLDQSAGDREDIHKTGVRRVLRGGSWDDGQDLARAVCRVNDSPSVRFNGFGFRVVVRPPS